MSQLFLVRHGQASLGQANYDQLSALGAHQSLRLGEHWRTWGLQFDAVLCGTLTRHRQTLDGIAQGLQTPLTASFHSGLNEYDADAVIDCVAPAHRPALDTPEAVKQHFRWLRAGLLQWMAGTAHPKGMPTWPDFVHSVMAALAQATDARVLVVSSGGPIAAALGHILHLSPAHCAAFQLQMHNTAVSELRRGKHGLSVVSFNTLPHLSQADQADCISYA